MSPLLGNTIGADLKTIINKFTDPDFKLMVQFRQQKSKFFNIAEALEILPFLIYH